MRKILTLLLITFSLSVLGQPGTKKVQYGLYKIWTPEIDALSYKLNGVTKEFSQWTTSSSKIYYLNQAAIGTNTPSTYSRLLVTDNRVDCIENTDYVSLNINSDIGHSEDPAGIKDYYGLKLSLTNTSANAWTKSYGVYCNNDATSSIKYSGVFLGGNFGIGTSTPSYTLDVTGTIRTTSYLMQQGIYAGIYVADASTAQSIANGTTYTKSTAFTTNGNSSNCTSDATNDKITITKTGKYLVNGTCSFSSGTSNVVWKGCAFLNGVEQSNIHWARKVGSSGDVGSASFMGTISVTSVPVDLDMRFRHNQVSATSITVEYSNLTVVYLGE